MRSMQATPVSRVPLATSAGTTARLRLQFVVALVVWTSTATATTSCAERLLPCPGEALAGEPCQVTANCSPELVCFEGTCVGEGLLRVSLAWEALSDFDLHVMTPSGREIYWDDPVDPTGRLDVDDCVFRCRDSTGVHVENVFFNADAEIGEYTVWVTNFNGRRAGSFFVEASGEGVEERWDGYLPKVAGETSVMWTFTFDPA